MSTRARRQHGVSVREHQLALGDAKLMEIIEGTTQIHQVVIADELYRRHGYGAAR